MTLRRHFLTGMAGLTALSHPLAQQPGRTYRLGWLATRGNPDAEPYNVAFVQRLGELGFVQGRNLAIEYASAGGQSNRLHGVGAELARLNCDVYLSLGSELTLVASLRADDVIR